MKMLFHGRKYFIKALVVMVFLVFIIAIPAMSSSGGGDNQGKGWVTTDTYRVMNFTVLAVALFFVLRKPVSHALGARIKEIKDQLSELEEKKQLAEKELVEYKVKLVSLDKEAESIIEDYIKQGQEAKVRILKEAGSVVKKLEEQSEKNIEHEFKKAKDQIRAEIISKSLSKAKKIIEKKINAKDQKRLVDEYLKKVVA
mmetsp:Transcript_21554/g.10028  ORF Transcript_21554/g.10028 Transcript_21554/m.10028 type:complete len:199 (-) Transcript_21554:1431-2027(-)